jgi:hypothetical protein
VTVHASVMHKLANGGGIGGIVEEEASPPPFACE